MSSKKRLLFAFLLITVFLSTGLFSTAYADDTVLTPASLADSRMFFVSPGELSEAADRFSGGDIASAIDSMTKLAKERGYTHIIYQYAENDEHGLLKPLCSSASSYGIGVLVQTFPGADISKIEKAAEKYALSGVAIGLSPSLSDTGGVISELRDKLGSVPIGVYIPMSTEQLGEDGSSSLSGWSCDFILALNSFSSYSEHGYSKELSAWREISGDALLITVNDLNRVLKPCSSGDFFGDPAELAYQYYINRGVADGFAVSSYSDILRNAYGSASLLENTFFEHSSLDAASGLSLNSGSFSITRPAENTSTVYTSTYTIFGTSDPSLPLYCDGEELEHSSSGVFAVQVNVSVGENSYTLQQGSSSKTVVLRRPDPNEVSTISKITSAFPYFQEAVRVGDELTLTCIAPSGGSVSANVDGQQVVLKQAAATAYDGVPATFKATFIFSGSGDYPSGETADIGNINYTLAYGGTSNYSSSGTLVVLGEGLEHVVKDINPLGGVETNAADEGNYITTLKPGCVDRVIGSEGNWFELSCGGYINKANVEAVLGSDVSTANSISGFSIGSDDRGEWLTLDCSVIPAFTVDWSANIMYVRLFNTEFEQEIPRFPGQLFSRVRTETRGDGSTVLAVAFSEETWGYNMETDEQQQTLTIYARRRPVLSGSLSRPLEGIVVTIDAGHGGVDPGALSIVGAKGANEADINNVNALSVKALLESMGATVVYNYASGSEKLEFPGRMDPAEDIKTDIYLSMHSNSVAESADSNLYYGTEAYYYFDQSAGFAEQLVRRISSATGRDNEGAHQSYYRVTRMSFAPSVLVECGYVSNPADLESLINPLSIIRTANAVAASILKTLSS